MAEQNITQILLTEPVQGKQEKNRNSNLELILISLSMVLSYHGSNYFLNKKNKKSKENKKTKEIK